VPSKLSEGRSNSWEPPRASIPGQGNNISSLGNSRVNENLHDRFNEAFDDGTSLTGPGPALINSINRALEEGRNKGLLAEEENKRNNFKKPARNESGLNLDPSSNPISSPKENSISQPISFPNDPASQPYNSQENTFRNLSLNEEKKRDGSKGRGGKEVIRDVPEKVYSDSNNQDTVKKSGSGRRAPNSEKVGFASESENIEQSKSSPIQKQEGQGVGKRENYHKAGIQNIWNDQSNKEVLTNKSSPPKRTENSKSTVSTPPRSEKGSNERKPRGSSDKRKNKDSPCN
jgi:hypothetical protein